MNGYTLSFPLNIIKEKVSLSLPANTEVDNSAIVGIEILTREFFSKFVGDVTADESKLVDKKLMVKDIKECIEKNKNYLFLQGLLEPNK